MKAVPIYIVKELEVGPPYFPKGFKRKFVLYGDNDELLIEIRARHPKDITIKVLQGLPLNLQYLTWISKSMDAIALICGHRPVDKKVKKAKGA